MTTGSIEQRLDRMEEHLTRHSECLEEITRSIEAVNIGIQGNREHDQPGYKQRILTLERDVADLNDLKKKNSIQSVCDRCYAFFRGKRNSVYHSTLKVEFHGY